jgi:hypothetical protein
MVRSARRKRVEEAGGRIEEKSEIKIKTIASGEEEGSEFLNFWQGD